MSSCVREVRSERSVALFPTTTSSASFPTVTTAQLNTHFPQRHTSTKPVHSVRKSSAFGAPRLTSFSSDWASVIIPVAELLNVLDFWLSKGSKRTQCLDAEKRLRRRRYLCGEGYRQLTGDSGVMRAAVHVALGVEPRSSEPLVGVGLGGKRELGVVGVDVGWEPDIWERATLALERCQRIP